MNLKGLLGKLSAVLAFGLVAVSAYAGPFDPCGSTGLWFSYSPPGDPSEQNWSYGKYFSKPRVHGAEYAPGVWRESVGHADILSLTYNYQDSPSGIYTVIYKVMRVSEYDPCTNVNNPTEYEVISQELGNRHTSFGGTNGVADIKTVFNAWARAEVTAGRNPLGNYRLDIQIVGVMEGEPTSFQEPITADIIQLRAIGGVKSDGSTAEQCDPREPGCIFNNGGTGQGGEGEPFDYGFFEFLKDLVNPEWWFNLFWPTEAQLSALKSQITETSTFVVFSYLIQSVEAGNGYMFESGSSEMVGEIGLQIYLPLNVLGTEVPFIIDLEPYEVLINIIRTLIFGSMLFGVLIWTRDRLSTVLSLGLHTLSSDVVQGYLRDREDNS